MLDALKLEGNVYMQLKLFSLKFYLRFYLRIDLFTKYGHLNLCSWLCGGVYILLGPMLMYVTLLCGLLLVHPLTSRWAHAVAGLVWKNCDDILNLSWKKANESNN